MWTSLGPRGMDKMITTSKDVINKMDVLHSHYTPPFSILLLYFLYHSLSNGSTENGIGGKFWLPFVLNWFWFCSLGLNLVWILICVWFELRCLVSIGYGGWFPSIYSWGWQWLGLDNSLGVSYGGSSWYNAESGNVYLNENSINK